MIKHSTRPIRPPEQKIAGGGFPFARTKPLPGGELGSYVEILEFRVQRAWTLISCDGPECCPNTWLLQASPAELVCVKSWNHLDLHDGDFPGSEVRLARLPGTHRLVDAEVCGPSVPREWPQDEKEIIPLLILATEECQVIPVASLPEPVRATLGLLYT